MVDEIKLDKVSIPLAPKKIENNTNKASSHAYTQQEDVTVTNNLSRLVNTIIAEDNSPSDQLRVMEMKQRIKNGSYSIDADALAGKLLNQVFSKNIGG